jgi:hypothetical protein
VTRRLTDDRRLDTENCEIVDDIDLLRILYDLGAPRMFVPQRGALVFYVPRECVQAARTLLTLKEEAKSA